MGIIVGCDMWKDDTPQQIYSKQLEQALVNHGFRSPNYRCNNWACMACGCVIVDVDLHWQACSARNLEEKTELLDKIQIAKILIFEDVFGGDPNIAKEAIIAVKTRFKSQIYEGMKIVGLLTRSFVLNNCLKGGVVDIYHFDRALKELETEKLVYSHSYFGSGALAYQDTILVRLEKKND